MTNIFFFNVIIHSQPRMCIKVNIGAGRYGQKFYLGIFQNVTSLTVIIFFMHDWVLTAFSTDWESKYCGRLTNNVLFYCHEEWIL